MKTFSGLLEKALPLIHITSRKKQMKQGKVLLQFVLDVRVSVTHISGVSHYLTNSPVAICYITFALRHMHAHTHMHKHTGTRHVCEFSVFSRNSFGLLLRQYPFICHFNAGELKCSKCKLRKCKSIHLVGVFCPCVFMSFLNEKDS